MCTVCFKLIPFSIGHADTSEWFHILYYVLLLKTLQSGSLKKVQYKSSYFCIIIILQFNAFGLRVSNNVICFILCVLSTCIQLVMIRSSFVTVSHYVPSFLRLTSCSQCKWILIMVVSFTMYRRFIKPAKGAPYFEFRMIYQGKPVYCRMCVHCYTSEYFQALQGFIQMQTSRKSCNGSTF